MPLATAETQQLQTTQGTLDVKITHDKIMPKDITPLHIDFINPQTGKIQEHIDYTITVSKDGQNIFGPIPLTHTSTGSIKIPVTFPEHGVYSALIEVQGILFQPITPETVLFDIISDGYTKTQKNNDEKIKPAAGIVPQAFAHTTVEVGPYEIEAGWLTEPPVVGIRNDLVFKITEPGEIKGAYTGVTSAFKGMDASIMYGGATKKISVNSDPRPGYYFAPIIPTKTGTYNIELVGTLQGTAIDVKIPIEDVESTAVLDFPPLSNYNGKLPSDVAQLPRLVMNNPDVASDTRVSFDDLYNIVVFSLFLGIAGTVLSVIALVKKTR